MNKERPRLDNAVLKTLREGALSSRCVRLGLTTALGASLFFSQSDRPRAQQRYAEPSVSVTGVSTSGGTVSISADGSLNRAQTWQDPEGFHVVLVNGKMAGTAKGVKVRRVGNSLELVLPVRKGANVTVNPRGNRLDLNVSGGTGDALRVENFETESGEAGRRAKAQRQETAAQAEAGASAAPRRQEPAADSPRPEKQRGRSLDSIETSTASSASNIPPAARQQPAATGAEAGAPPAPAPEATQPPAPIVPAPVILPAATADEASVGESLVSSLTSTTSIFGLLGASVFGGLIFTLRRRRKRGEKEEEDELGVQNMRALRKPEAAAGQTPVPPPFETWKGDRRRASIAVPFERRRGGEGAEDEASRQIKTLDPEQESKTAAVPAVLFGAYRIDQEVECLVGGRQHSIEVLSSRAADDRRALETSLLKALRAPETDEDGQRRARTALEDYGFVARQCAALLLGAESFDRASAARTLGEMRSPQALPFLTEALYDGDAVVRTEVVQSLGALGLPSAIGALLDIARRHPELPAEVLGTALTACSVESTELSWPHSEDAPAGPDFFDGEEPTGDVRAIELASGYEELPEWMEDAAFISALEMLDGESAEARTAAAQQLAQFPLRRGVQALSAHAVRDRETSVRAAAVTSLGVIGHESVFVPVLLAMADEAREVRAAAARALSRLSFDRADAYVRVLETADPRTLGEVARACVKTGLATQAINRLASEDRRQAYESFSLLSLVVKAGELGPVLETVESHRDIEVRLACIRLLGLTCPADLGERLLHVANDGGVPEKVRQAIIETVELAGQPR